MWFGFSRKEGFPTQYAENQTPVTVDVLEAGFITAFIILGISFLIAFPTTRLKNNLFIFLRIGVTLLIGLLIMLGNFGQEWEVGHIRSRMPYKAGIAQEINGSIGLRIGLRSVNVTLTSRVDPKSKLQNEIIDYNERFSWTWDQGRFGFGPFAGHLQQEFRAAQYRGIPIPILWVVDYFVIDGEGFRFGRFYRTAGWYCHIALWSAFTCWLLAVILLTSVIRYGAYCLLGSGILQLTANLLWLVIRNPIPMVIPFEDDTIRTKFGTSYWLTFVSGLACIIIGVAIIVMDIYFDSETYMFFGVDPLNRYAEVAYLSKQEQQLLRKKRSDDLPLIEMNPGTSQETEEYVPVYLKRHTKSVAPPVIRSNKPKRLLDKVANV